MRNFSGAAPRCGKRRAAFEHREPHRIPNTDRGRSAGKPKRCSDCSFSSLKGYRHVRLPRRLPLRSTSPAAVPSPDLILLASGTCRDVDGIAVMDQLGARLSQKTTICPFWCLREIIPRRRGKGSLARRTRFYFQAAQSDRGSTPCQEPACKPGRLHLATGSAQNASLGGKPTGGCGKRRRIWCRARKWLRSVSWWLESHTKSTTLWRL